VSSLIDLTSDFKELTSFFVLITLSFKGLKYNFHELKPVINKPTTHSNSTGIPKDLNNGSFVAIATIINDIANSKKKGIAFSIFLYFNDNK